MIYSQMKTIKLNLKGILGIITLCMASLLVGVAYADENPYTLAFNTNAPIKITISTSLHNVQFDGEWSFRSEWKHSTYDKFEYDDKEDVVVLRTAHQDKFFYIFIDYLSDFTNDHIADRAIVCFDGYDTSSVADESDWCYAVSRGSGNGHTLQGGSPIYQTSHFNLVKNHPDFVAHGGTSGENDRYVATPHAAYEFRIPIEQIGFQDEYGFFVQVYDGNDVKTYPKEFSGKFPQKIPSPVKWGKIVSPDHSISNYDSQ